MAKRMGIACVILGIACLLSAVAFVFYNHWEAQNAAVVSQSLLAEAYDAISENQTHRDDSEDEAELPNEETQSAEMAIVSVDGYDCIGVLSIPVLELELPVLSDWSYAKLKKSPCHYYGSYYESDFVIAAHNYQSHFGRLSQLQAGDAVIFTDANGLVYAYEVVLIETLPKEATEEMIASGFHLSLYTCTPGGGSRVTVRCRNK